MRRSRIFWGALFLLAGLVLLLKVLGLLPADAGSYFWPLVLVLIGIFMLFGARLRSRSASETLSIPLEGAESARVELAHGAGKLSVDALSEPGMLLAGAFSAGAESAVRRSGNQVDVTLRSVGPEFFPPFYSGAGNSWQVNLARNVPIRLELNTGANEAELNLTDLTLSDLILKTGASSTRIRLPARAGFTRVEISSGAASVDVSVPADVAARIHATGGLAGIRVDTARFPRSGGVYETPGYDTAQNRVEIHSETGVGSIEIHS